MEAMIQNSDAFVIFPGGAGTVQEMLALLIFKQSGHPLLSGKPIVLYNRRAGERGFWDKLIELLKPWQSQSLFTIVDDLEAVLPTIDSLLRAESSGATI
jgi:predicted Rossmann-fold nucleotide-binding protein